MKISYANKKTERLCFDIRKATKDLGKDVAIELHNLINAMEAFPNLQAIKGFPQYRLHSLIGERNYQYSLTIDKRYKWRLVIYPLDEEGNLLKDRSNEKEMLTKAVKVEVLEVSEHYE